MLAYDTAATLGLRISIRTPLLSGCSPFQTRFGLIQVAYRRVRQPTRFSLHVLDVTRDTTAAISDQQSAKTGFVRPVLKPQALKGSALPIAGTSFRQAECRRCRIEPACPGLKL